MTTARRPGSGGDPAAPGRWRDDRAGLLAAAGLAVALAAMGIVRWRNHWAGALDLGLFDQGIWLLSRLRAPELTVLPDNLFGDHLSPVLVLYAPLYRLLPSPGWLILTQAAALGLTVLPMRALARDLGAPEGWATFAVVASAPIWMAALYDFHPVALTLPLVTWALVAGRADDVRTSVLLTVAVGLVRADAAVLLLGVAVVATPRVRRAVVPVALVSAALGALVPALLHTDQTFARYYGTLGASPGDAILHPWRVVTTLTSLHALRTLLLWLLPVGCLPLLRPRWLLALLVGGFPVLLSSQAATALPWFHHAATVAPLAIGGALAALADSPSPFLARGALVVGLVAALLLQGPLAIEGPTPQTARLLRPRDVIGLDAALARVGPTERVAADSWIVVELAHREHVYPIWCDERRHRCGVADDPGDRVDVVVTSARHTDLLEDLGWEVEPVPGGDLVVARPADAP